MKATILLIFLSIVCSQILASDTTYIFVDKKYNQFSNLYILKDTGHFENTRGEVFSIYEDWGIALTDTSGFNDYKRGKHVAGRKRNNAPVISFRLLTVLYEDIFKDYIHEKFVAQRQKADTAGTASYKFKQLNEEAYYQSWYLQNYRLAATSTTVELSKAIVSKIISNKKTIKLSSIRTQAQLYALQKKIQTTTVFLIDENQSSGGTYFIKVFRL